ncbi:O-antigen/teichoic acid export membrane protein [Mucilaginibacter gracilis]|uniref:O-antigen/teichoic acid export membrane protein n=1 Tax=Mucilaginibacter gracilis TaxID=423350 RepID=A0A495IZY0_9SPHI|nr:MATE family efflux transporter [Mucilaginibacter gracilis]RKR82247.1 O-antigen/teichoic acid export membrane protein [Mucilaginibacter gracilis]
MRSKNALRNFSISNTNKILSIILGLTVTPFIYKLLGKELYGINALVFQALGYLSMAELGVGTVMVVAIYKPLADQNYELINRILSTGQKLFNYIGLFIFVIGGIVCFFFDHLFKISPSDVLIAKIVFFIFLLKTVITYFFSSRFSLISASQKGYKLGLVNLFTGPLLPLFNLGVLYLGFGLIGIAVNGLLVGLVTLMISIYIVKKEFPWLNLKSDTTFYEPYKSNLFPVFMDKLLVLAVFQTDYILISSLIGVAYVAAYAMYTNLFVLIRDFVWTSLNDITHGIGELYAKFQLDQIYALWRDMINFAFIVLSVVVPAMLIFTDRFIQLWIGKNSVLPHLNTILFVLNLVYLVTIHCTTIFINAKNFFWQRIWGSVSELIVNVCLSLYLIPKLGTAGALAGTFLGHWLCNSWYIPKLFMNSIGKSLWRYYTIFIPYLFLSAVNTFIIIYLYKFLPVHIHDNYFYLFLDAIITCIASLAITLALYAVFDKNFKVLFKRISNLTKLKILKKA